MSLIRKSIEVFRTQRHPFIFLLSRFLMISGFSRFLIIRRGEYSVRFYPTPSSAILWMGSDYEREEEGFLRSYLRPGDVFVDVGANIGMLSLLASGLVGSSGRVYAIEAHPRIHRYLVRNVLLNRKSNINCIHAAMDEMPGELLFSNEHWDELNAVLNIGEERGLMVPSRTLDSLPTGKGSISLLKIDTEGYELKVLRGGTRLLKRTNCVYFESNAAHLVKYGHTCDEVFHVLRNARFVLLRLLEDKTVELIKPSYVSKKTENLIAVKNLDKFLKRTGYHLGA